MAYAVGTGANAQDFLDALRSFALGLGWTINKWDTTAKRLYMEKGVCHVCFLWDTINRTTYQIGGGSSSSVAYGRILGSLCKTIGASNDFSTFAGVAMTSGNLLNGAGVTMSDMTGPFVGWFLFSNATGDYIHAVVQTAANRYSHLHFGMVDKGSLTHSGVAYLSSDGDKSFYRSFSTAQLNSTWSWAMPQYTTTYFGDRGVQSSQFVPWQAYSEDALPAGFLNQQAIASNSGAYARTPSFLMPLQNNSQHRNGPSFYGTSANGLNGLADPPTVLRPNGYSAYVPMMGLPVCISNVAGTQFAAVGSIPDLRLINMTNMSAGQEFTIGADTWKVFPMTALMSWNTVGMVDAPNSGQHGIALKKIV